MSLEDYKTVRDGYIYLLTNATSLEEVSRHVHNLLITRYALMKKAHDRKKKDVLTEMLDIILVTNRVVSDWDRDGAGEGKESDERRQPEYSMKDRLIAMLDRTIEWIYDMTTNTMDQYLIATH